MNKKLLILGLSSFLLGSKAMALDYSEEIVLGLDYTDLLMGIAFSSLFILIVLMIAAYKIITGMIKFYGKIAMGKAKSGSGKALMLLMSLGAFQAFANDEVSADEIDSMMSLESLLITIIVVIWILIFALIIAIKKTISSIKQRVDFQVYVEKGGDPKAYKGEVEKDILQKFTESVTDAVSLEHEESIMMKHEYDGIKELDNNLPPWWKWTFYVTMLIAVVYLYHYHLGDGLSSAEEYTQEMKEAEMAKNVSLEVIDINENNAKLLTDAKDLSMGAKLYASYCKSCHGVDGGGGDGPNFTDRYWLHGGGFTDIFKTIKYGVPEKGMSAWGKLIDGADLQKIASYVYSLEGTNPTSPKAPQGILYDRSKESTTIETVVDTVEVK